MKKIAYNIQLIVYLAVLQSVSIICYTQVDDTIIQKYNTTISADINSLEKLAQIYPKSVEEIQKWTNAALQIAQKETQEILAIKDKTFANTMQALDISSHKLQDLYGILNILSFTHPDQEIRDAVQEAIKDIQTASIDLYLNPTLYHAIQEYADHFQQLETLTPEDQLLLDGFLESCKRSGMHLPEEQLNQVKLLSKELAALEQDFLININNNNDFITVTKDELQGVSDNFINQLARNNDDTYQVPVNFSTYITVMTECNVTSTRKALYLVRKNMAYPENDAVLIQLLTKRDELAAVLGYPSYAAMDLTRTSAETIENVETFLTAIADTAQQKAHKEIALLKTDLPNGVTCNKDGTLNPWDYLYSTTHYNKKHYNVDESAISQYFPSENVINGIFNIYQNFLGLTFKKVTPQWSWHEDVYLIEIYCQSSSELLGYLFLDLYTRPNKYPHACVAEQIGSSAVGDKNKTSVAVLITNFQKPSQDTPSLLKHNDIVTFFHEFGHAMHFVLGRTKHASHAGFNVSCDFAEVPSQMFEEWMFEPEIMAQMSQHYQTKQPLDLETIQKSLALRQAESGFHTLRQCMYALFALRLMTNTELSYKPAELWRSLDSKYFSNFLKYEPTIHDYAAFGHLAAAELYGAKYYSYLWTKVFAIDLYTQIKQNNYNTHYSQKVQQLLSAGGSVPSHDLLTAFLEREPNQDAFFAALGLK